MRDFEFFDIEVLFKKKTLMPIGHLWSQSTPNRMIEPESEFNDFFLT